MKPIQAWLAQGAIKTVMAATFITAASTGSIAVQAEGSAQNTSQALEQLLNNTQSFSRQAKQDDAQREAEFKQNLDQQAAMLQQAKAALKREQQKADQLKQRFDNNEVALVDKEEELRLQVGNLGEMFGVVRQVSGDLQTVLNSSLTQSQQVERQANLDKLAEAKELPTLAELEKLWHTLQQEMLLNGQVARFNAQVNDFEGKPVNQEVTRIGLFNTLTSEGHYLAYDYDLEQLGELGRQPADVSQTQAYLNSTDLVAPLALDPSRGALLNLTLESPDLWERVQQGALVGYIIIALGALGLLIAAWRLIALLLVSSKVSRQQKQLDTPSNDNPLGRVLNSYGELPDNIAADVLEAKMDEVVLRELPALERGQAIIKLFAGIAPLLGLLGTVTGMIATFQAITNFGTGDPKLMASGISQALITTVLGLLAAIPLLLAHTAVASRSKRLVQLLDEQSAGLMAQALERQHKQVD